MTKDQRDKTCIYALVDPTTKEIRYVGKADDPQARLSAHLQEKGDAEKNQWLKSLLAQGQIPELRILEEVSLSPFYLWAERERWWIVHLREQGARLTNSVVHKGYAATENRELAASFPPRPPRTRRRAWQGHYQSYAGDLLPGRGDGEDNEYAHDRTTSFDQEQRAADYCERLPDGRTYRFLQGSNPDGEYLTWFAQCVITIRRRLPLGVFPVGCLLDGEESETIVYPTEPGVYTSYLWKEQVEDCRAAKCKVKVQDGWGWCYWAEDMQAWRALCQELEPHASIQSAAMSQTPYLYNLATYLLATPPYPLMLHWFSYAIMQANRQWYHTILAQMSEKGKKTWKKRT